MNRNHIDLITEPNISRSSATGTIPRLLDTFNDTGDFIFELFNRPERLAIQADHQDIIGSHKIRQRTGQIQKQM
jgi:hypothetical protein